MYILNIYTISTLSNLSTLFWYLHYNKLRTLSTLFLLSYSLHPGAQHSRTSVCLLWSLGCRMSLSQHNLFRTGQLQYLETRTLALPADLCGRYLLKTFANSDMDGVQCLQHTILQLSYVSIFTIHSWTAAEIKAVV